MKRVTSQNIGNDGVMMNFEQIKNLLSEMHFGDEIFVVVFNDDDNFIQVSQPSISDIYEIEMRTHHNNITKFRIKGVIGVSEVEKYFKAYYDNESWLFEDFNKWLDMREDLNYNIKIIGDNEYFKDKLESHQIMAMLPNLKINDVVVLSYFRHCYYYLIIRFYQIENASKYSLQIIKNNKIYWKAVDSLEIVQNFVSQYLNNEDIDLKSWSGPYYG